MKCIGCGRDSNYKDRSNRTCPGCNRRFAFEPRDGDPVTDMLFKNAIEAVSGNREALNWPAKEESSGGGGLRWGVEHLYYEICRRKRVKKMPVFALIGLVILAILDGVLLAIFEAKIFAFLLPAIFIGIIVGLSTHLRGPLVWVDLATFNTLWRRWQDVNGKPEGVIERVPEPKLPTDLEGDIGDYSFDRAVICDRARTVDLLVANNFHFENNCAILSIDGYPKGPFAIIKKMIKRNPRLQIFVLHDATPAGCRVAQKLVSDPEWFGGSGLRVIDLGLRPRHSAPFQGLFLESNGGLVDPVDGIFPDEVQWLTSYRLELAAIRPEQVLKRLFAGLQAHANDDPHAAEGSSGVVSCSSFESGGSGDGGADGDGGSDAFG